MVLSCIKNQHVAYKEIVLFLLHYSVFNAFIYLRLTTTSNNDRTIMAHAACAKISAHVPAVFVSEPDFIDALGVQPDI